MKNRVRRDGRNLWRRKQEDLKMENSLDYRLRRKKRKKEAKSGKSDWGVAQ